VTHGVRVRAAVPGDAPAWARMRAALWPDADADELLAETARHFAGGLRHLEHVLVAVDGDGAVVGFAELNLRPYAEGCTSDRVAFLEGWYVAPEWRRRGVGAALVATAEAWARGLGCTEFGSDAVHDNDTARRAHAALGFEEVEVIRCFRKRIGGTG
jgi:aminoglycoside 6'-N-acetyltransferase I